MSFELSWEWLSSVTSPVRSHELTWARLMITVGNVPATRVIEPRSRSSRDGIYEPLMPLAEWIVDNWWHLNEEAPPDHRWSSRAEPAGWWSPRGSASVRAPWFRRHNLLYAREGFPLPDLSIARIDDDLSVLILVSDPSSLEGGFPVRFVESHRAFVDRSVVESQLRGLVDAVVARLDGCNDPDARSMCDRWDQIRSMDDGDRALRRSAAALGLDADDPDSVDDRLASILVTGLSRLPIGVLRDLLDSRPDVARIADDLEVITNARRSAAPSAKGSLRSARSCLSAHESPSAAPYELGWAMAAALRSEVLGLSPMAGLQDVQRAVEDCGLLSTAPGVAAFRNSPVRGWVGSDTDDEAVCVLADGLADPTHRFAWASALGLGLQRRRERLLTIAATRSQAIARAFATELLAPIDWVRSELRTPFVGESEISALARTRGIQPQPIRHQIENHDVADVIADE